MFRVTQLADWAEKDRKALLRQLNSYLGQKERVASLHDIYG
jgi:hypothetical protein